MRSVCLKLFLFLVTGSLSAMETPSLPQKAVSSTIKRKYYHLFEAKRSRRRRATLNLFDQQQILLDKNNELLTRLINQNRQNQSIPTQSNSGQQLLEAVKQGDLAKVREELSNGAYLWAQDQIIAWNPLQVAAWHGHIEIVEELLAKGAHRVSSYAGATPLNLATINGHSKIADLLARKSMCIFPADA